MSRTPVPSWVSVGRFRDEDEARLLAGRLQAEGVDARIYPEFQGSYYAGVEAMWRPFEVLVPAHEELLAREIVDRLNAG